ncbi:LOB domain-containing protein 1-like [Diospyros lotus]|uniref:LOB domain-containing protein 1-like n=1 Tax=Diospyros lotus TaxID=55363 RepID=UPI002256A267|nr:LOB domain-containing protein 1-like [Diospyros lotus]
MSTSSCTVNPFSTLITPSTSSSSSAPTTPLADPQGGGVPRPPVAAIQSPCAACKILRRRCVDKCVLAPYFPPNDPLRFTIAHRVFGASNIIKFLQELPESKRADAVSSMVYEANARIRDPVYGSAGAICHLQQQVSELQAELARAQAELANMQCQHANLLAFICSGNSPASDDQEQTYYEQPVGSGCDVAGFSFDDTSFAQAWESLWT